MRALWKLCVYGFLWLGVILLFSRGARNLPWLAVGCIALASAFAGVLIALPVFERTHQKKLRRELRRVTSLHFRETDGEAALDYLFNRSVWAWRQYARLKAWEAVRERHFDEFRRAALQGDLRVTGRKAETREEVIVPRRYWEQARVDVDRLGTPLGVSTKVLEIDQVGLNSMTLHRLAVSTRDMREIWPPASLARRLATTIFVWLKVTYIKWCASLWHRSTRWYLRARASRAGRSGRRQQAEQITAWFHGPAAEGVEVREGCREVPVKINNASNQMIYDLVAYIAHVSDQPPAARQPGGGEYMKDCIACIGSLPPGGRVVRMKHLAHGTHRRCGVEFAFQDAGGRYWFRHANGELQRIRIHPVDFYGLSRPVGWETDSDQ
jgi:hypothetical protein